MERLCYDKKVEDQDEHKEGGEQNELEVDDDGSEGNKQMPSIALLSLGFSCILAVKY